MKAGLIGFSTKGRMIVWTLSAIALSWIKKAVPENRLGRHQPYKSGLLKLQRGMWIMKATWDPIMRIRLMPTNR